MRERPVREAVLTSDPRRFREARRLTVAAAREAGLEGRDAHALAVAVSEVCANVHRHAYGGRRDGRLDLRIEAGSRRIAVVVIHEGVPFDPRSYVPPDLSLPAEGGYGLYLVSRLVDAVTFASGGGESRIVLVKEGRGALAAAAPPGEDRE